ncbi:MAG: ribosome small subunit-dependent GTPase [Candidatus Saccharibacteria bacterium]|nr:ribosome small subunit-dependent GTPase [Candidatus Saccharibacteria bacterium]
METLYTVEQMSTLQDYGWNDARQADWDAGSFVGLVPARIIADFGQQYRVALPGERIAQLAGALAHKLTVFAMPKIGDWVAVELSDNQPAIIQAILPRTSEIVRGHVGRLLDKQVVAANVDLAFIVQPLDHDFSPERLERYIFQLASQNIDVVILLNKSDTAKDIPAKQAQLTSLGADVVVMSALKDPDMAVIEPYIVPGNTIVILGSSGAGKSTLTNRLLGEQRQATQTIRERDSKGRHTTVHRELFLLPGGGMIIDTPGIRELQLWGTESDLEASFPEIFEAIRHCHYPHCSHITEDRCGVKAGLADGTIDPKRYKMYLNFQRELQALETRRGFIEDRRSEQTKESAKRRQRRLKRSAQDSEPIDYENPDA